QAGQVAPNERPARSLCAETLRRFCVQPQVLRVYQLAGRDGILTATEGTCAMGFLDRLFGRNRPDTAADQATQRGQPQDRQLSDEQAIERYKYMLRTAPPEAIEQAHEEAFARLTSEQRQAVLNQLAPVAPE